MRDDYCQCSVPTLSMGKQLCQSFASQPDDEHCDDDESDDDDDESDESDDDDDNDDS